MRASSTTDSIIPLAARRHPMIAALRSAWRTHCPPTSGRPIVVACSGGADSTALAVASVVLREQHALDDVSIILAYVHHHLRVDADDDADAVGDLARRLNAAYERMDIEPADDGGNLSSASRRRRYGALTDVARRHRAAHVIAAHHADDQAETMLMAFARGAGLDGLSGLRARRPLDGDITLDRPMLRIRRSSIESFLSDAGIAWREDPTNRSSTSRRATVRHNILPRLDALWPGMADRLTNLADVLEVARDVMDDCLEAVFGPPSSSSWPRSTLANCPAALIAAGLRRSAITLEPACADQLGSDALFDVARGVRDDIVRPRRWAWPEGLAAVVTVDTVCVQPLAATAHPRAARPQSGDTRGDFSDDS